MTGKAMGLCGGNSGPGPGRGGRGAGRGWRKRLRFWRSGGRGHGFDAGCQESNWAPGELTAELSPDQQRSYLKGERNRLKARLAETEAQLGKLGQKSENESEA